MNVENVKVRLALHRDSWPLVDSPPSQAQRGAARLGVRTCSACCAGALLFFPALCLTYVLRYPHLQAVTCDDFLAAMADANGEDLSELAKCVLCRLSFRSD